jgi:hypothetical protein
MSLDRHDDDWQARLAQLESENAALRAQLESENAALRAQLEGPPPAAPAAATVSGYRGRSRWWTALAATLIVIGCLLAPLAVIGGWGKTTLTDTDAFVATYAPLAHDPVVQNYVVDQASASINANLDVEQLTSDVIDGIKSLGVRPRASVALDALKAPATQGIQNLIRNGINAFVTSDAFAQTWERALEISHKQLLATLNNDPNALIAASADGTIGVQLGPIVEDVKAALVARGIDIAARIPPIDRTIPIAQSDQIPTVQAGYRLIVALGTWLPWVALIFLTAGVLVARRRSIALVWAAIGLSLSMLVLLIGFGIGRALLLTALPGALVPGSVTTLLYDTATAAMKDTALSALVLGAALALIAWLAGPFRGPSRLRALYNDGIAGLRSNAEQHGVTTGRVGAWAYAQRRVLHVIIALAAALAVILLRPLSGEAIAWILILSVVVLVVLSLVERPAVEAGSERQGEPLPAGG